MSATMPSTTRAAHVVGQHPYSEPTDVYTYRALLSIGDVP